VRRGLPAGAAALPAAPVEILIALATTLLSRLLAATLTATLATLTTLLTTLLLTVTVGLTRVIGIRASHNASNANGYTATLANCFSNVVSQPQSSNRSMGWKMD